MIQVVRNLVTQPTARRRARLLALGHVRRLGWRLTHEGSMLIGLAEHLGDLVAAEPIARHLKSIGPQTRIAWAANRPYAELVGCFESVDVVLPLEAMGQWLAMSRGLGGRVIDLHLHGRWCAATNILIDRGGTDLGVATYYDRRNLLSAFCEAGGIEDLNDLPGFDPTPRLRIPEQARVAVDALGLPARFVAIHARSNDAERDWHADGWIEVVNHLAAAGVSVVEVGLERSIPKAISVCGTVSLPAVAEVIRRAALFIGVDSGPAHVANAVGTEGVILLGDYRRWTNRMPYSGRFERGGATILRHAGPLAALPAGRLLDELQRRGLK